jgi:hypothetical protein
MAAIDFPNSPTLNQEFTANGRTWIWNGTVWSAKIIDTSVSRYDVQDTAPTSPTSGDVWFNSTNARTYVYYDSAWVESNPALDGKSGVVAVASPLTNTGTDSSAVLGVDYSALQYGQNAIINGGMDIWQRGTTITNGYPIYGSDRWMAYGAGNGTHSRQATGDTTLLPNIQYAQRIQRNSGSTLLNPLYISQSIETTNSRQFSGQVVTLSWYARAGANYSASSGNMNFELAYGTGTDQNLVAGFTGQAYAATGTKSVTTSWQRFTATGTVPASATQVGVNLYFIPTGTAGANDYLEITGVQVELGAAATPFKRAGGTIQGELAACQRYYQQFGSGAYINIGLGQTVSGTAGYAVIPTRVTMRTSPTMSRSSDTNFVMVSPNNTFYPTTSIQFNLSNPDSFQVYSVIGTSVFSGGQVYQLLANNGYIYASAEL